jgi:hypothetical protein
MVLGAASTLLCFTWILSLPMWGLKWMGESDNCTVLRTMAHKRVYKAPDKCHCVPLLCSGRRGVRTPFLGVRSPRDRIRDMMLIIWIPIGPNPLCRSLTLPGRAYLMLELSWRLCMSLWWSSYVRQRRNGFQHSSACCQVHMGACGYVLSCQIFNTVVSRGPGSGSAYRALKAPGWSS